ncbi:DUF4440 domain-containing protein [Actinophytocola sp. NPDC049390]|uniref:DUF4440 domain-containing protein n=1 Tax=Actinophytocola sp. NPDC049390 TaxID=3363894 RepID=UPI00379EDEC0
MTEANVAVEVEVDPATAFDLFTRDIAAWWRADRSLWGAPDGELRFENGALMQGDIEIGRVSAWEPGPRLAFSYGPPGVDPAERTDVEVRFEAVRGGTRVVVRHGGWEKANWAGLLAGFARHSLERMLLARLGDFLDAIADGNVEFFARNLTDEAMLIFPGDGNTYTKEQCVAAMVDHPIYHKYELTDPHIVHIGDSTAVLTHRATVMHEQHERPMSVAVSSVLVHRDGEWRLALHQWTQ